MTNNLYFRTAVTASVLMLTGSIAFSQATIPTDKKKATTTQAPAATVTPRVDQYGQASGKAASAVQPYKDGEDMTTRYRPGNNTTTVAPTAPAGDAAEAKKHVANIKWAPGKAADATVTPASSLDGGSKDAAKMAGAGAAPNGTPNKMAIKENGIAKPTTTKP